MKAAPSVSNLLASAYKTVQHEQSIFKITISFRYERGSFRLEW
jgi:acyl-CoA thioesterase